MAESEKKLGTEMEAYLSELSAILRVETEQQKLLNKDLRLLKLLLGYINLLVGFIKAGQIGVPEVRLFSQLVHMFIEVEKILWELKRLGPGYPADPPFPPLPPELPPPELPELPKPKS